MATIGVTRGLGDHDLKVHDSNIYIKPFLSSAPEVPHEVFVCILYIEIFSVIPPLTHTPHPGNSQLVSHILLLCLKSASLSTLFPTAI